jgi:endonuclease/exonuclease/phosphatase family metal-dependent hydrolase
LSLRLLTYNILASPVYVKLRSKKLLSILERSNADIIALQEVTGWFLDALVHAPWIGGYQMTRTKEGEPFAPGGQLILSRKPIESVRAVILVGGQRRTLLIANIRVGGRLMSVATTHMESYLDDGAVRAAQLTTIFELLAPAEDALLMGDLNFGQSAQPETSRLDPAYVDVWTVLRGDEAGFTWDIADNPIARIGAFVGEPSRRLDRILLRSPQWKPKIVSIIGNRSAGQRKLSRSDRMMIEMPDRVSDKDKEPTIDVFPSDHYGLTAVFERQQAQQRALP